MADKAEKKPEAGAADAAHAGDKKDGHGDAKGGLMSKTPVLLGGVMIIEAIVLFAGFKYIGAGAPQQSMGAELHPEGEEGEHAEAEGEEHAEAEEGHGEAEEASSGGDHGDAATAAAPKIDKNARVEMLVLEFKAPNKQNGRMFLYDVSIYAVTKGGKMTKLEKKISDNNALIRDRVRTIIAQSDPEKLGGLEPGLETLRRQIKYQLDEIVGEGMIEEVLVPRCIPFRAD